MIEKKRIACFFTGGYTEVNSMKLFLRKINSNVELIQLCPTGKRKSRKEIQNRAIGQISTNQNGLTGESLIDHIVCHIQEAKLHFKDDDYDAILIEDDKDDRFLIKEKDGSGSIDCQGWQKHKEEICNRIHEIHPNIPVLLIYAAPEVETWFLADWENSFGKVYSDSKTLKKRENHVFATRFRQHINQNVVTSLYRDNLEAYGYFDGVYRKLSQEIQNTLERTDFLEGYPIHETIRYSKKNTWRKNA